MANSFSLSTSGAVPGLGSGIGGKSGIQLNSNVKKAASSIGGFLGGLGSSNPASIATPEQQNNYSSFTRNVPTVSGLLPSTPVKSVTTPDGHVTTYHAPAADSATKSSSPTASSAAGTSNPSQGKPNANGLSDSQVAGGYSTVPGMYNPVTGHLKTDTAQPLPVQSSYQQAAQKVYDASQPTAQEQYYNNMAVSGKELANHNAIDGFAEQRFYNGTNGQQLGVSQNMPDLEGRAAGESALSSGVGNLYGSAAQTGYANALQARQLALGGAENVLGASAPVSQFGQLTDPFTGRVVGAGSSGNNPQLDSAVANAIAMVKSGSSITDAQNSLAGYGQAGVNAFNNAQIAMNNGSYNPTATNAQVQQNVAQGQQYQAQATAVDTGLKAVKSISQNAVSMLQQSGYNSTDSRVYNEPINQYLASFGNSGAAPQIAAYLGDIKKYTSQILAANTGTIPTDTANTLAAMDPSYLNGPQLERYLETIDYLGSTQRDVLQKQATASYGQSGGYAGSVGVPNAPSASPANTSLGSGIGSPTGQAAAGLGMSLAGDLEKIIGSGANLASFIAGKVL